jgi:signal transduction histidine kinase
MSLKKRLLLILTGSGFILAVFFHFSINTTMIPDIEEQKGLMIRHMKNELKGALNYEVNGIASLARTWATWQEMGNYVEKPTPEFEKEYLSDTSFLNHLLNMILILDDEGEVVFSKNYRKDVEFIPLKLLEIDRALETVKNRTKMKGSMFKGVVSTHYGPMVVGAYPVNESSGIVVLGRFLDEQRLKRVQTDPLEKIRTVSFKEKELFQFYLKQMQGEEFFYREDKKGLTVLCLVKDIFADPSLIMAFEAPGKLFWVAKQHTLTYVLFSVFSILALGGLIYFLIEKYINKRITSITAGLEKIESLEHTALRLEKDSHKDEISLLIHDINQLLARIEKEKKSRESAERQLITNEKLVSIGRLSSSIAHEINNPMLAISNCFQALKKMCGRCEGEDSELHHQAIAVSETEINRIREIIASLLDFHQMEVEEFSVVDLNEVLLQSLEVLKWSKKLNAVKINSKKQQKLKVLGSQGKLKQVFINFILNAVETGGDKDKVLRVEMLPSDDQKFCNIHFYDNGPGIPPEIKDSIFEPFVSSKQGKGVGLGLYVSYKIINNHNGEITYDDSYTDGAHFIVKLPLYIDIGKKSAAGKRGEAKYDQLTG